MLCSISLYRYIISHAIIPPNRSQLHCYTSFAVYLTVQLIQSIHFPLSLYYMGSHVITDRRCTITHPLQLLQLYGWYNVVKHINEHNSLMHTPYPSLYVPVHIWDYIFKQTPLQFVRLPMNYRWIASILDVSLHVPSNLLNTFIDKNLLTYEHRSLLKNYVYKCVCSNISFFRNSQIFIVVHWIWETRFEN